MEEHTENENNAPAQAEERNVAAGDSVRASWPVSLDDLQKNVSNSSSEAQELISWCFLWCIDDAHPLRLQEFAKAVGVDSTTIYRVITGKYLDHTTRERVPISPKLTRAMAEFRKLEIERAQGTRTGFILTPTAKRIHNACDLARESQSPVFLVGPSHIGKTWALTNYTEDNNHGRTIYVRMKAASGLGGMVKGIAGALGISEKANTADLIERVKRALKPNMLLIIDELHQLFHTYRKESFFACLEVIREFYDASNCGLVLCGTELMFKRVKDNRGELEQLLRRGVHKVFLPPTPLKGDVAAIVKVVGLEFPEKNETVTVYVGGKAISESPYEMLRQVGKDEGLKALTERLRYGQKLATKARERIAWSHVVRAHFLIRQSSVAVSDWE